MGRHLGRLRFLRGATAVCIAAVLSLLSLAPLMAQWQAGPRAGMSCCRTMKKCCCRNKQRLSQSKGPQVSSSPSCAESCKRPAARASSEKTGAPALLRRGSIPIYSANHTAAVDSTRPVTQYNPSRYQRPPPNRIQP